jgi:hypothetical protein
MPTNQLDWDLCLVLLNIELNVFGMSVLHCAKRNSTVKNEIFRGDVKMSIPNVHPREAHYLLLCFDIGSLHMPQHHGSMTKDDSEPHCGVTKNDGNLLFSHYISFYCRGSTSQEKG